MSKTHMLEYNKVMEHWNCQLRALRGQHERAHERSEDALFSFGMG